MQLFFFPKLKLPLRRTRSKSIENIKRNSQRELKVIPSSAYAKCMKDWVSRYHSFITHHRDYFGEAQINIFQLNLILCVFFNQFPILYSYKMVAPATIAAKHGPLFDIMYILPSGINH